MARHLVRSFILTSVLCSLVNAGPCRPPSSSTLVATTTATETDTATTGTEKTGTTASDTTSTAYATLSFTTETTEASQTLTLSISDTTTLSASETFETSLDETTETTVATDGSTTIATTTKTESAIDATTTSSDDASTTTTEGDTTTTELSTTFASQETSVTTTIEASTTTAEPAPSCVNNLKDPSPEDAICAKKGYPTADGDALRYLGNGVAGSALDCYRSCMETPNCKSFAVQENAFCEMYRGSPGDTDSVETPFMWYETDCFCETGLEPAPTCEDTTPILNGGWDTGDFSPWQF
ncbi:hypothetical protein F66182_3457 [Fusarium sp. NRRL 66182]|nr:hypothetical protein F66182_3457 [Fusarium sp. NRRL 66182]